MHHSGQVNHRQPPTAVPESAGFALPAAATHTDDPLEVFRLAASISTDAAVTAQQLLTAFETRAVPTAKPTRGSADLIITAQGTSASLHDVARSAPALLNPARDLAFIGARLDAELRRQHAPLLIQVAFVEADLHARERSQTAPPGPRTPPHPAFRQ